MSTIRGFEGIEGWQKARELTRGIYAISKTGEFSRDFALRDQIRRASISVMSNIAEGFERGGTTEFLHFLSIAKASAAEVESQLYVALDQDYITQKQFDALRAVSASTKRLLAGLMAYLQNCGIKGQRFKTRNGKPETRNP